MSGSVLSYCGCRAPDGRRYRTGECPKWAQRSHRRWMFVVDLPRVEDPDTGHWRRQQLKKMGFATRRDAERALEAELPGLGNGTAPSLADRQLTVADYLDGWLQSGTKASGAPWRPCTRQTYARDVRLYLRPGLGRLQLVDLRADSIKRLWARMRDQGRSEHVIRSAFDTLNSALGRAILEERITRNPCVAARVANPARPEIQAWTPEQVSRFLDHAREAEPDLAPAFQLAAWRGLRRGELLGLRWSDIDWDERQLTISRNVTEAGGELHTGEPKTKAGRRTVSLGPLLVAALRAHRKTQAQWRLSAEEWEDHDLVFPGPDGRLLQPHVLTQGFKRLAGELGLPGHLHTLRHTAATSMLLAGVAPKVVQDQLGHAHIAVTLDVYGHVLPKQREDSAEAIERLYGTDSAPR